VPIQKVFDTFSAVIQIPLLRAVPDKRGEMDKRTCGELGKQRMKDFRDAKRAMEQALKEAAGGGGKKQKKVNEQPLVRKAIMNASRKE
jgi:hypothetical protein